MSDLNSSAEETSTRRVTRSRLSASQPEPVSLPKRKRVSVDREMSSTPVKLGADLLNDAPTNSPRRIRTRRTSANEPENQCEISIRSRLREKTMGGTPTIIEEEPSENESKPALRRSRRLSVDRDTSTPKKPVSIMESVSENNEEQIEKENGLESNTEVSSDSMDSKNLRSKKPPTNHLDKFQEKVVSKRHSLPAKKADNQKSAKLNQSLITKHFAATEDEDKQNGSPEKVEKEKSPVKSPKKSLLDKFNSSKGKVEATKSESSISMESADGNLSDQSLSLEEAESDKLEKSPKKSQFNFVSEKAPKTRHSISTGSQKKKREKSLNKTLDKDFKCLLENDNEEKGDSKEAQEEEDNEIEVEMKDESIKEIERTSPLKTPNKSRKGNKSLSEIIDEEMEVDSSSNQELKGNSSTKSIKEVEENDSEEEKEIIMTQTSFKTEFNKSISKKGEDSPNKSLKEVKTVEKDDEEEENEDEEDGNEDEEESEDEVPSKSPNKSMQNGSFKNNLNDSLKKSPLKKVTSPKKKGDSFILDEADASNDDEDDEEEDDEESDKADSFILDEDEASNDDEEDDESEKEEKGSEDEEKFNLSLKLSPDAKNTSKKIETPKRGTPKKLATPKKVEEEEIEEENVSISRKSNKKDVSISKNSSKVVESDQEDDSDDEQDEKETNKSLSTSKSLNKKDVSMEKTISNDVDSNEESAEEESDDEDEGKINKSLSTSKNISMDKKSSREVEDDSEEEDSDEEDDDKLDKSLSSSKILNKKDISMNKTNSKEVDSNEESDDGEDDDKIGNGIVEEKKSTPGKKANDSIKKVTTSKDLKEENSEEDSSEEDSDDEESIGELKMEAFSDSDNEESGDSDDDEDDEEEQEEEEEKPAKKGSVTLPNSKISLILNKCENFLTQRNTVKESNKQVNDQARAKKMIKKALKKQVKEEKAKSVPQKPVKCEIVQNFKKEKVENTNDKKKKGPKEENSKKHAKENSKPSNSNENKPKNKEQIAQKNVLKQLDNIFASNVEKKGKNKSKLQESSHQEQHPNQKKKKLNILQNLDPKTLSEKQVVQKPVVVEKKKPVLEELKLIKKPSLIPDKVYQEFAKKQKLEKLKKKREKKLKLMQGPKKIKEPIRVLPKPVWTTSGQFNVEAATPEKRVQTKSTTFQIKLAREEERNTVNVVNFKERALYRKGIPREDSHNLLKRRKIH